MAALLVLGAPALAQDLEPGDLERGRALWAKCRACHTVEKGGRNLVGPRLHGMFARKSGEVADFRYSPALKSAGLVWNDDMLDRYLAATQEVVPGGKMYGGLAIAQDRADLIAWLKKATVE